MNVSIKIKLLDEVTAPLRKVSSAVDDFRKGFETIEKASHALERFKEKSEHAFERSERLHQSTEAIERFSEKAHEAVEKIVGSFEPFEVAMSRVKAVTGATKEQMEEMETVTRKVGSAGRFGAVEAARALEQMRQEGMSVNEAIETLPKVVDAAVVANVSLGEAIESTSGILDAFALEAKDFSRVTDVAAAAALASGTSFAKMSAALSGAGRDAVEAGIPIERLAVLAGSLAQRNIEGGEAAGVLGLMLKVLHRPMGEAHQVLTQLGVATERSVNGVKKMRDPLEILTEVVDKMDKRGISANNQMRAMTALFPRAAPEIMAMVKAAREPGMEKLTEAMKDATGKTAEMANVMRENGTEAALDLKGAWRELAMTIGKEMAPQLERTARRIEGVVRAATGWIKEHPALAKAIGITIVLVASVAGALAGLMTVLSAMVAAKGILLLATGYAQFGQIIGKLFLPNVIGAITWLPRMALSTVQAGVAALGAAAPFIAIGLAIGAVTLAIVELVKHWKELDFGEVWKGIKDTVGEDGVLSTIGQALNPRALLEDIGIMTPGGAAGAKAGGPVMPSLALGPSAPSGQTGIAQTLAAQREAPRGLIEVKIDSEGRPTVKKPRASGGIELEASAGLVLGH